MKKVLFYCDICTAQVPEIVLAEIHVAVGSNGVAVGSNGDLDVPPVTRRIEHACRNCRVNFDVAIDRLVNDKGELR